MSKRKRKGLRRSVAVSNSPSPDPRGLVTFKPYAGMSIMATPPFSRSQPAAPLQYDAQTGEALYPYAPGAYRNLHIVGHLFENGEYLPVKVFVAPEIIRTAQHTLQHQLAEQRAFWRGVRLACAGSGLLILGGAGVMLF